MLKKNKISFFMNEWDSDLEYEEGDCFDLDDECKPIPKVLKKQFCDKTRIAKYLLFLTIITLFGYIFYNTMFELYK